MNDTATTSLKKKILRTIGDLLLFLVILLALAVLMLSILSKKDADGAATVFGYQMRFVRSESMAACPETDVSAYRIGSIPVKSCVIVETIPEEGDEREEWLASLRVGDVLTFRYVYTSQETITHRIIAIKEKATGGYLISLAGDNKSSESGLMTQTIDTSLEDSPNYIIGRVIGQSYALGLAVYALKSPIGIVCLILVPCLIIIILEILRIVNVLGAEKKKALLEESERRDNEIEELKRKLAMLEESARSPAPQAPRQADAPPQPPAPTSDAEAPSEVPSEATAEPETEVPVEPTERPSSEADAPAPQGE